MKREIRFLANAEIRAKADGSKTISGYAALFNSMSEDLGGFREIIRQGAFTKTLANGADVRALFNHEPDNILGRTTAGTLRLKEDSVGLFFECDLPDTTYANDLYVSIKRGDINQSSFGFYCVADNWVSMQDAPGTLREVLEADVFDCSPVTFPAYQATSVNARSLFPDGLPTPQNPRVQEAQQIVAEHERRAMQERALQALLDS
jgi:Escherichia/Staphylococcus phage prohead protease